MFDNSQVSDKQVIKPAPRVENCKLVKLIRNEDKSVTFLFNDSAGAELAHREFMPNKVINGNTLSEDEFKKSVSLVTSRIAHITRAFVTEQVFLAIKVVPSGNVETDWIAYIKLTGQALEVDANGVPKKAINQPCALKVVYTKTKGKYYAGLPKVPVFISTENHRKEFTTNPQYDLYEIPKITPDTEKPQTENNSAFTPPAGGDQSATGW